MQNVGWFPQNPSHERRGASWSRDWITKGPSEGSLQQIRRTQINRVGKDAHNFEILFMKFYVWWLILQHKFWIQQDRMRQNATYMRDEWGYGYSTSFLFFVAYSCGRLSLINCKTLRKKNYCTQVTTFFHRSLRLTSFWALAARFSLFGQFLSRAFWQVTRVSCADSGNLEQTVNYTWWQG